MPQPSFSEASDASDMVPNASSNTFASESHDLFDPNHEWVVEIPEALKDQSFETFDELFEEISKWCELEGFGIIYTNLTGKG